jgi:hypothetical protein
MNSLLGFLLLLVLAIVLNVKQGHNDKDCRKGGGVLTKTEQGYQCLAAKPIKPGDQGAGK